MVTDDGRNRRRGMRRVTLVVVSTVAVVVLLFSYRTSRGESGSDAAQVVSPARVVAGTPGATTTGQGNDPNIGGGAPPPPSRVTDPAATAGPTAAGPAGPTAAGPAVTAPTTTAVPSTPAAAAGSDTTVDGAAEMTRYGVVQVEVTISGGRIADVVALQYPQRERRDVEINNAAIPELHDQVIAAQSANVDGVSGATYTTEGYLGSLQSALDAAGFAG